MDTDPASIARELMKQQTGKAALGFDPKPVFSGFGAAPDKAETAAPAKTEGDDA